MPIAEERSVGEFGGGGGDGFAGAANHDALLTLVIEVDVENGGSAVVPHILGDGEVEEDHAFGGLAGVDHGLAEEGFGGEGLEGGEGGVEVGEVVFFDGAGGDLFAVAGGESGGEVFEEEGQVEAVGDAEGGEDVEVILTLIVADEDGFAFEDGVGGVDGGVEDIEVGCSVRGEAHDQSQSEAKDQKGQEDGCQQVASSGLGKLEVRHWDENSKADWFSED